MNIDAYCSKIEHVYTWWTCLIKKGWCFNVAVWFIYILSSMFECSCSVQAVNHTPNLTHTDIGPWCIELKLPYGYLEPICPLFRGLNPPNKGLQGSREFQVNIPFKHFKRRVCMCRHPSTCTSGLCLNESLCYVLAAFPSAKIVPLRTSGQVGPVQVLVCKGNRETCLVRVRICIRSYINIS